jgi:hypothetical protein
MIFLHPALLWLLPVAAIPILLHLLTLHRLKTVELSTYRFLFDSYVQQRRQMQFLEALLAMLRALFLLLLVVLVGRPAIKHWNELFSLGSGRDVVFLVDCSASMNARTGGVSAIDRAKSAALAVAGHLGKEDRLTLVRVGSRPQEIFNQFARDAGAVRDKIEGLKTSPSRGNFFAGLQHVFGSRREERRNSVVYCFTDCQANGWREVRDQGLERMIPQGTQLLVVNVGSSETGSNLAVIGDAPRRNRVVAGLPLTLQARVINHSKLDSELVTLSTIIDEKEIARTQITLKAVETLTRKVVYVPTEPGELRGRFEITTKGPDRFPDDDRFLFTLSVVPRLKVLLVNGNPSPEPLDNAGLYLKAALTTEPDQASDAKAKPAEREIARALDVQEIQEGNINPELLQDASVIILSNCGSLNGQQFTWLRDYVSAGGGLVILPGDRVNPDVYNEQLFVVPGPQGERMTAVRMQQPVGDPDKAETFERFGSIDFGHPILAVFDDPEARYLRTAHFGRRFPLVLPEKRENTWSLAEFSNGTPALVESRYHDGVVLLAAFPAGVRWTNLPLKLEFVPLVLRMVSYLEHRPPLEVPPVVPAEATAEVSLAGNWSPTEARVTDGTGRSSPLNFERSGSRLLAAYDRTDERGYYNVEVAGARLEQARGVAGAFAVNLAPEESELETVNEGQLHEMLPGVKLSLVDASAEAQQLFGAIGNEREVWRPLIFVLFAIITLEFTLATLGGPKTEGAPPVSLAQRLRRLGPRVLRVGS